MVDEIDLIRREFPIQAWVPHERFMKLQLTIIDRRISHLLIMQGIAPEKGSLANLTPKELKKRIEGYQEELHEMMKKVGMS